MRARSFGIGSDAEIAGIAGMQRIEEMPAAERGADRQREALGKAHHRVARRLRPAAAAEQHDRTLGRPQELLQLRHLGEAGPGLDRLERRRVGHRDALGQHVLGSATTTGPGRPLVAV